MVNGLLDKVLIFSDVTFRDKNIAKLKNAFINNGYSESLLNKLIRKRVYYFYNKSKFTNKVDTKKSYLSMPHINQLTDYIKKTLKPYELSCITSYSVNNLNFIFNKHKPKLQKLDEMGVVYKINCKGCTGSYIGQTKNKIRDRIKQHKYDSSNKLHSTALVKHVVDTGHLFDFDNVVILEKEKILSDRLFLEMVHINKTGNCLNFRTDIDNLSSIYSYLLTLM